ncbi:MAG: hypothetical protein QM802_04785 [Agriterribacter sp.]
MHTYIVKIHLQEADEKDYSALHKALQQRSFIAQPKTVQAYTQSLSPAASPINFIRKSALIQEVVDDVVTTVKQIGRKFSFTIMKSKN